MIFPKKEFFFRASTGEKIHGMAKEYKKRSHAQKSLVEKINGVSVFVVRQVVSASPCLVD